MSEISDEIRDELLNHFIDMAEYWANVPKQTEYERCEGLVFSILVALDGCSGGVSCAFDLVSSVHEDDEDQSRQGVVISEMLHEHYMQLIHKRKDKRNV